MKKMKKGFTLLELIIVIAVIAILVAVLIPTFSGIIKKSQLSTDIMACKNLNTTATSIQLSDAKTPQTMSDVIKTMSENGYNFDKLKTANPDNVFVYDSTNNKFFVYDFVKNKVSYKDDNTNINLTDAQNKVNYWIVSNTYEQTNANLSGFSVYLKDGYTGPSTINITTGLDVGTNDNITMINYTNTTSQTVTIVTNGGALKINGKNDNIKHYGSADTVNIIDVATASYHENGEVKFMEVSAGHVVIEKDADVSAFHFTATGEGDSAKFENEEGKKISIDLSEVKEEKMPTFSRDPVVIEENGTYVAQVKTESTEYIWLFGQGIKEQMVVTNTNETIAENGTLKQNVEIGAEDGSVAEQIANPARRNNDGELVDMDNNVVTVENAVVEVLPAKEDIQTGATLFNGGTGSEKDPYIITNEIEFANISEIDKTETVFYRLANNINYVVTDDSKYYSTEMYNGDLDLNGKTLSVSTEGTVMIFGVGTYANVHNGTVNMSGDIALYDEMNYSLQATLVVDSVDFTGTVTPGGWGPHYGVIDCYAGNTSNNRTIVSTVIINNVNSWVDIKANATCVGGLLGYCLRAHVSITNTNVYSHIESGYGAGGIIMSDTQVCGYDKNNATAVATGQTWGTVENVKFYGNILVPEGKKAYYFGYYSLPTGSDADFAGESATLVKGINIDNDIIISDENEFKINASTNYTKYVIRLSFSVDFIDDRAGGYPRIIEKEITNNTNQVISTGIYKNKIVESAFNEETDTYVTDSSTGIFTRDGVTDTYFYDGIDTYKLSKYGVTVTVYAYNGESLKAVGSYSYPKN